LEQEEVRWVVGQVLARHDLSGRYPDLHQVETAERVAPDGERLLFVLNHRDARVRVLRVLTETGGLDLLSGASVHPGDALNLDAHGVVVLRQYP
jgi:beta-galactosidase